MVTKELIRRPVASSASLLRPIRVPKDIKQRLHPARDPSASPDPAQTTLPSLDLRKSLAELRRLVSSSNWRGRPPLHFAHQILSDDLRQRQFELSRPGPSTYASKRASREWIFTELINAFRSQGSSGLAAISSLLSLQVSEKIPISTKTKTAILKLALDSQNPRDSLPIIQAVLPSLPETIDLHLLTLVISALQKSSQPSPAEVERLLTECLAARGVSRFEEWPLGMYDLLMQSHRENFRGGAELLGRLQPILLERAMSDGLKNREDKEALARPFITLMDIWTRYSLSGHRACHSTVPAQLAKGLFDLLGDSLQPPREFVNVWMNAERLSDNRSSVFEIWNTYYGDLQSPTPDETGSSTRLKPDSKSFTVLWKSFKSAKRPLPRSIVGRFLLEPSNITTESLNAALSSAFMSQKPHRTLIHILLSAFKGGAVPNARTIDLVSAGLIRIWRRTSSKICSSTSDDTTHREIQKIVAHRRRLKGARISTKLKPITLGEWDLISREILRLRTDKNATLKLLPLGKPLARLESPTAHSATSVESSTISARPLRSFQLPLQLSDSGSSQPKTHVTVSIASPKMSKTEGKSIMQALKRLLESSMIEQYRHHESWNSSDHKRSLGKLIKEAKAHMFSAPSADKLDILR